MAKRKKRGAASRSAQKTRKERIPPQRQDGPSAWGDKDLEQVKKWISNKCICTTSEHGFTCGIRGSMEVP